MVATLDGASAAITSNVREHTPHYSNQRADPDLRITEDRFGAMEQRALDRSPESQDITDWLYLETIGDLEQVIAAYRASPTRYLLVRMSALLRKLLTDNPRLIDLANRGRHLKPVFRVRQQGGVPRIPTLPTSGPRVRMRGESIIPGNDSDPVVSANRDSFLKMRIGTADDLPVTVRDIIRFGAHVEGGVHAAGASTQVERILRSFTWAFISPTTPSDVIRATPIAMLFPIAVITVDALVPLTNAVRDTRRQIFGVEN